MSTTQSGENTKGLKAHFKTIQNEQQRALLEVLKVFGDKDRSAFAKEWRALGLTQTFGFGIPSAKPTPKSKSKSKSTCQDGKCKRPRGRAPKGKVWDSNACAWADSCGSASPCKKEKKKCNHQFVRGDKKGQSCQKNARKDNDYCSVHYKAHEDSDSDSDPYDSDPYDSDLYDSDLSFDSESDSDSESD